MALRGRKIIVTEAAQGDTRGRSRVSAPLIPLNEGLIFVR